MNKNFKCIIRPMLVFIFFAITLLVCYGTVWAGTSVQPVGWWRLEGDALDSSGNGYNGTLTGSRLSGDYPTSIDRLGNSVDFFQGAWFTAPVPTAATENVGISAWVKWTGSFGESDHQPIAYNGNPGANGYGLFMDTTGGLEVLIGGVSWYTSYVHLPSNTWQHVALVGVPDGETVKWTVYLNGNPVYEASAKPVAPDGSMYVGHVSNAASVPTYFRGWIDNVQVYDVALTSAQVQQLAATYPVVTGVSPASGLQTGGRSVTVTGTGFSGATSVSFGGTAAASYTVNSATSITATAPAQAAGTVVHVTVTTPLGGTSADGSADQFTYVQAPAVTGISPGKGPVSGGTLVTITGTFFSGVTGVSFGGTAAASFTINSDTSITAFSPAHAAGTVDVTVTTPSGSSDTGSADNFTYSSNEPAGWWKLGEGTGTTAADSSGYGYGGTLVSPVWSTSHPNSVDQATASLDFSGGSSMFTAPIPAFVTSNVSISAWVKWNGTTGVYQPIAYSGDPGANGYGLLLDATGKLNVLLGGKAWLPTTATLPIGAWAHVAAVEDGSGNWTVYLNGSQAGKVSGSPNTPSGNFLIGYAVNVTTPKYFSGLISDVGFYTTALTIEQVKHIYSQPEVTGVSPTGANMSGGTTVTITGYNFTGATGVSFGSKAATSFTVVSDTSITAVSPAQTTAGTVDVTVTNPYGTSITSSADYYTFAPTPAVTALSQAKGHVSGGTVVAVTGSGFTYATGVSFGGTAATSFTVNSDTSITAVSPAQVAGAVDVIVTTPYGTSAAVSADQFTYSANVLVGWWKLDENTGTAAADSSGYACDGTLAGPVWSSDHTPDTTNLISAALDFSGGGSRFTASMPTIYKVNVSISAWVKWNGTTGVYQPIVYNGNPGADGYGLLLNPSGKLNILCGGEAWLPTTATLPVGTWTHVAAVEDGSGNWTIYLNGSQAGQVSGTPYVPTGNMLIGYATNATSTATWFCGLIDDVRIYTAALTQAQVRQLIAVPAVSGISPASGIISGGTEVTVTGINFSGATAVTFGGTTASSFTVNSDTLITAVSPAHSAGTADVTVTNPYGTSAVGSGDKFTYLQPTVTGVSPAGGPISGGTEVTVTGYSFAGATAVSFGGTAASSFTVNSDTSITAVSPAHSAGTADVTVTTSVGTSTVASGDQFTYAMAPEVTGISPAIGTISGGRSVTISGTDFIGATGVSFGGTAATSFIVNSDTSIRAFSPTHIAGTVDVTVASPGGTSAAVFADQFTYSANVLVGWWKLSEGSGTTAVDSSGYAFDGTLTDPVWSADHPSSIDQVEASVDFSGGSKFTAAASKSVTGNVTLSAWVKWNGATGISDYQPIAYYGNSGQNGFGLFMDNGGYLKIYYSNNSGSSWLTTATVLPANAWSHVAMVSDGSGNLSIYLNGILDSQVNCALLAPGGNLFIGCMGSLHFPGLISDVRIYAAALTDAQIQQLAALMGNDATLCGLTISSGSLTPAFDPSVTAYNAGVANSADSITVTPATNQSGATVKVDGTATASGSASGAISLNVGDNSIEIEVTAPNGTTTKTYTITVTRSAASTTGIISGMVTDGNTNPVSGANVSLTVSANVYAATTASNGSYSIPDVPVGTDYTVTASKTGYTSASAINVNVTANTTTSGVNITLTALPPATHIVSVSANPAAGGSVTGGGTYNEGASVTVTAAANSGYTFTNWTESGTAVSTNAAYTFTLGTTNRTLVSNFTEVIPDITKGTISGTVTDGINPVQGANVRVTVSGSVYSATTAANGSYSILNISAGTGYTVTATKTGYNSGSATNVSVTANTTTQNINITLTAAVSTTVTLLSATADGVSDTTTSTKIDLTFDTAITGLTASDITITNGTGAVVKGALTGSGMNWSIALTSVTTQGNVSVAVSAPADYTISGSPKTVAVYKAVVPTVTVTSVTVAPPTVSVQKGTTQTFTAAVNGTNSPAQTVTWSVYDNTGVSTAINASGLLTVAADETAAALTVTATSTVDNSKSGTATVTVTTTSPAFVAVTDITGVPATATAGTPLTLTGTVAPANAKNQTVVWSVYNAGDTGASIEENILSTTAVGVAVVRATITNGFTESTDYTQDFNITVAAAPVTTYTVTASADSGGSISPNGIVNITEGSSQTFTITSNSGYQINSVTVDGANQGIITTYTFTNVTANHTITATFTRTSGGGGGGGGGSSSTPATPAAPTYNADVKAGNSNETTLPVTVDKDNGTASTDVGSQKLTSSGTIITVPPIPDVNAYSVSISVPDLSTSDVQGTLTLHTDNGSVTVPSNMLTGVSDISGSKAEITIGQGNKENLPEDVKTAIGDRPLVQLTLSIDGKQTDWSNRNASVTVSIPYTPTAAERANPESIVVWYIDGSGKTVSVPNGHYDPATGRITFDTTHFSDYAVAYNPVRFNDVAAGAWYDKAVGFIAARGITSGTGNGKYSPEAKLTRGEFIVLVMEAYGIAPDTDLTNNFSDAGNTYYTGYLAEAKRLGISSGVGNNMFAPGKEITRQETFTLLYNVLKVIGQLPHGDSGKSLSSFTDAGQVDSWAKDAMTLLVETGTIGGNNGMLTPTSTTTRAEMAQVLYNLLEK